MNMHPDAVIARPLAEWHEDIGPVLWWRFPIDEPPYVGTPLDNGQPVEVLFHTRARTKIVHRDSVGGWPGYHTHFTPIQIPEEPTCTPTR